MSISKNYVQNDLFDFLSDGEGDTVHPLPEEFFKPEEKNHANPIQTVPVSEGDPGRAKDSPATDHRDSESLGTGMAQDGEGTDKIRPIPGSVGEAGGTGEGRFDTAGEQPFGEARDSAGIRPEPVTTRSLLDFVVDADDIGQGGLSKKYRDNIAAIRIIKAMELEDRLATDEERKQIARYVGWGALKGVFDPDNKQWAKQHLELKELLTDVEFRAARKSTLDAHYTSPTVINAMYGAMQRLGFSGGRILESSVGIGNFFGLMPTELRNNSQLHGVELDGLTSKLVTALYPEAKIKQATGFEDFEIPADYFDGCVGNPPFGSQPVVDKEGSDYSGLSIHNYFLSKSIDKLRPGGIMAVVVSHSFLDAQDATARQWIGERAALIGAARLPNTAFKENAGTEVVADILIFQKRDSNGLPNGLDDWREVMQLGTTNSVGEFESYTVNKYFYDNRQVVLGKPTLGGGMYRANTYTVEPTGDLKQQLSEWVDTLPVNVFEYIERKADDSVIDQDLPESIKVGSYFVNAYGVVMQRGVDVLENKTAIKWMPPNDKATARMKGMIALRDSLRVQMRLERLGQASDAQIEANRAKLNVLYDDFLRQHGHLNNQTNRRLFLDDTESQLLQALEFDYDKGISKAVAEREGVEQKPPSAVKADIFKRRVAFPPQDYINVSTAKDALLASLNYRGKVDLEYMAEVYNKSLSEIGVILEELGDVVYVDPQGGYVTADEYLSGDVKSKLVVAQAAALEDAKYQLNIGALEKVIPKDKTPSEISVSIGATFVPADVYEQYVKHISGGDSKATYIKSTGQWLLSFTGHPDPALNTGKYGTSDLNAQALFQMTLMGRGAIVKKTIRNPDGSTYTVVLEKETAAAREKQNTIKDEWKRWLWSDPERADRIVDIYNEKMNRIVNRKFDGTHLTFPGMNPAITLLEHQKNGVWRGLQSYQVLYDQVVGAGKTFEMATLAMEMRRLGISKKPLLVVPNHLTLQWRSEFTRLYPGSNILAATPEDFSKDNRERLFSKIVTGDWDAVIIGHSSLKKIGLPEETEKAVLQEQIDEIGDAIEAIKRERGDRHIIRDMEGIRSRLEAKMKLKLASIGTRSKVVSFDELGIDSIFVDEVHEFKNLTYNSTMDRNPGMGNPNGSAKAFDLFVKVRWLFDTLGEKAPFITATGTPVSNSLVEMYNMQRYMQYPTLKREGLHVFDAWAKQFGSVENVYEVAPSGSGYRQSTRFAKFTNLPALMGLYNSFADTVTLDDLKAQEIAQGKQFPVPKLVGGKPVLVVAERSPDVAALMGVPRAETDESGAIKFGVDLANEVTVTKNDETGKYSVKAGDRILGHFETEQDARLAVVEKALSPVVSVAPDSILGRFGRLKELTRATKGKVNALSLTGEANKAGLDYRLIDPTAEDFAGSKINLAVGNMLKVYHQWESVKGTQLVFCDMSIPLSARTGYLSKDRRLYVRDDDGSLLMKRGTLHTLEGHESLPYFVVQRGDKDAKRFDMFDAASGVLIMPDSPTKQEAIESADALLLDDVMRHDWLIKRETVGDIDQALIDDYNNEHEVETEGFEYFSREDIAGMSGSSQFSVYDDIKAKLIANGVPKREIAFIHDYSTPVAKEKLFKAVNAGDIRFLLGSTPKLGAGTNVQKRLVGLHHIDAPWRPSDLEQREGRIIRRGNELYARDPENFSVFIGRYATEQTYDTRRWQILEHKARGIEQLRNFDGTINEIEDIDGEASNSADMKAAASGDPLILEETKLRNSVRRLEQLQASHADEVLRMSRKARDKKDYAETYGPRYLADLGRLIDTVNKHPLDKDNFSPISVNGNVFVNRELAQDALSSVVNKLRGNALRDATVTYRGIEFTLDRHTGWIGVSSETGSLNNYSDTDLFSSNGFVQRMANYVGRLPSMVDETKTLIQQAADDAASMRKQTTQEFSQAAELDATRDAYKSVQRALLAKGPVVPDDQKEAVANGIAGQKALLQKLGYGSELNEFFKESSNEQLEVTVAETRLPDTDPTNRMDAPVNNYGLPPISSKEVSMNKKAFHEVIAEKLIEQLQQGTAPWQRPWQPGEPSAFSPMNPTTGKRYRGINAIQLMMEGRADQRWLTYKQAAAAGGQVMKGEKGTPVQYWKFTEEQVIKDENGKPRLNDQGEKLTLSVKLERPRVFFATVFNAEQIEGLPPVQPRKEHEWNAVERAERILQASGAVIRHSESDRAFYRLSTDSIHLPPKDQFESADRYYATALHELGHWSGASQRLARDLAHPFGSEGYSKEELRAEIFSMLLGDELGIGHDPGQHAAYVASWVAVLKNDPLEIFRAAADAEKIQDYVLALEQTHLQEQSVQTEVDQSVVVSTNQETNMQAPSNIAAQDILKSYQFVAHEVTSDVFLTVAVATPLVNHGRQWEVFVGEQSFGFSDGITSDDAMREVHKREVNNALYSLSNDNAGNVDVKSVPPDRVLNEYPDLLEKFANALPFNPTSKTVINVPFKEKDDAKELGAKWDRQEKSWYVPAGIVLAPFDKWMQKPSQQETSDNLPLETARFWRHNSIMALKTMHIDESRAESPEHFEIIKANKAELKRLQEREAAVQARYARFLERRKENTQGQNVPMQEREYLAVPYGERAAAKAAGAVWDKTAKSWYVGPDANMSKLERWKPDNVPSQQLPAMRPEEEFSEALRSLGCVVSGEHPIMDGTKHRITVDGDKTSEKSGFYVGHLDGHPAGYIKNNRTGVDMKWKSKGYALDPEEKAQMQAEAANKLRDREVALQAKQKAVALDVVALLGVSEAAPLDHPYLVSKQARAGGLRVVPSASTVLPDNTNIIIGKDWKESAALRESHPDKLVFTEGDLLVPAYDTDGAVWTAQTIQGSGRKMFAKDSVKQANFHVVGATGNGIAALVDAPAIVIGEGYATADSLSKALGFPTVSAFDSGNLELVAKALRDKYPDKPIIIAGDDDKHLESTQGYNPGRTKASDAAKAVGGKAIFPIFAPSEQAVDPKKFCDFNDLATKSALGAEGIKRQVCTVVDSVIEKHLARSQQQPPVIQKARVAGRGR
jgi:N12 class adenine-specific DNA methylase/antirestriction protein ArdC/phage/plasmid primase-like uncharacterized protein